MRGFVERFFARKPRPKSQPPVFCFERTLRDPSQSPRAAEYGFAS